MKSYNSLKMVLPCDWYLLLAPGLFLFHILLDTYTLIMPDTPFREVLPSVGVSLLLVLLLSLLFLRAIGNIPRSSLLASLAVMLLAAYGQIDRELQRAPLSITWLSNHLFLAPLVVLVFLVCAYIVVKVKSQIIELAAKYIFLVAVIVPLFPVYSVLSFYAHQAKDPLKDWKTASTQMFELPALPDPANASGRHPDIYSLVLDSYGRSDILQREFAYDNSGFLDFLEQRGFYVADQARSNYLLTILSISSALNLTYLNPLPEEARDSANRQPLKDLIQHSRLRSFLSDLGYRYVAFDSGYSFTRTTDADLYLSPFAKINEFEELFFTLSAAVLADPLENNPISYQTYNAHRKRIIFTLNNLQEIPEVPGPKFVFAHLLLPHPPFIFGADGEVREPERPFDINDADLYSGSREEYLRGYASQVEFTNQQLRAVIQSLLTGSETPPIILIQGDHGPRIFADWDSPQDSCILESTAILNAIYAPHIDPAALYPTITPINTFRVLLNETFGSDLDLLEDRTYFSNYWEPYHLLDVTGQAQAYCNRGD